MAASGTFTYQNCYLEAKGVGDDHADVIQAYAPGARGTIVLRNTHIRAYNQAATAGLWVADNWTGGIDIKDTIFQGGPYGLRFYSDVGGDVTLDMENVYFVGPFGAASIPVGQCWRPRRHRPQMDQRLQRHDLERQTGAGNPAGQAVRIALV